MYRKLIITFVATLLVGLCGSAFGAAYTWDNEDGNDNYWHSPRNWDPNSVPGNADDATITGILNATPNDYPVLLADANALSVILYGGSGDSEPRLRIEPGATLNIMGDGPDLMTGAGWGNGGGIIDVNGGDVDASGAEVWIGYRPADGVPGQFFIRAGNLYANIFEIARSDDCPGGGGVGYYSAGQAHLDGGTVDANLFTIRTALLGCPGPYTAVLDPTFGGWMDITGGTMLLDGDQRWTIGNYYDPCGWITAYGVGSMDVPNIVSHERARMVIDFDWRVEDRTMINAYKADWGEAYDLTPVPYADPVPPLVTLTWKPGDYVGDYVVGKTTDGHHVKFGPYLPYVSDTSIAYPLGWSDYGGGKLIGHFRAETNSLNPLDLIPDMNALELDTIYYWRVVEVNNLDVPKRYHSLVQAFRTVGGAASNPSPGDGATVSIVVDEPLEVQLSWSSGYYVADVNGHELYFGTDFNDVNDADTNDTAFVLAQNDVNYLVSGLVELNTMYYWRIDEVNDAGPDPCMWKGDVWSFYVGNYRSITEFPNATDSNTAWDDGWVDWWEPACGSGWGQGSLLFFSDGSMTYDYANGDRFDQYGGSYGLDYYSEARYDAGGKNWVYGDPDTTLRALVLNFQGDADNAVDPNYDRMWLAVEDSAGVVKAVTHPEPGAHARAVTDDWNIDLRDLSGLDLNSVSYLYLGFGVECNPGAVGGGTPGGTGVVVFNNIRSYMERCVGESGYTIPGDIDGDCFVDMADVDRFVDYWLARDRLTGLAVPVADDDPNMLARYEFEDSYDNDPNGTAGSLANGEPCGTPQFVYDANRGNKVLYFDQDANEWVDCNAGWGDMNNKSFAVMCWQKQEVALDWACLVCKGEAAWKLQYGMLAFLERQIHFATHLNGWVPPEALENGQWYHVAGSFEQYPDVNGGMGRVYVNGMLEAESDVPENAYTATHDPAVEPQVFIGAKDGEGNPEGETPQLPGITDYFAGYIDDARVYNRLLSEEEIMSIVGRTGRNYYAIEPPQSWGNFYNEEPRGQRWVNMRDFAVLGNNWLKFDLWPLGTR